MCDIPRNPKRLPLPEGICFVRGLRGEGDTKPADYGDKPKVRQFKGQAFLAAKARREEFLKIHRATGRPPADICRQMGISIHTYKRWRDKYPDFAARYDIERQDRREEDGQLTYTGDFDTFRRVYMHMKSPWFHLMIVNALESCEPGQIVLILCPPEHGKTTLLEDFINYKLGTDPQCRVTVVSEQQKHAKRVLRRVKARMEFDGGFREYVLRFGPFTPQDESRGQPWAEDHFDVFKRGQFDERDYNAAALGITSAIAGARADWLILDDCQSLKSLNQTESIVDKMRQDFFSRPGMKGRICILGTRVGEDDIYNRLIDADLIDKLIVFPAHNPDGEWLWPERYSADEYRKMRKRVGEQAWFRNYMQRPSAAQEQTFTHEIVQACHNTTRSVIADCPQHDSKITPVVVTLDPALGGANCIMALGFHPRKLLYLSSRVDHGLTRTEQIFDLLEQTIIRWNQPGVSRVTEVVIEANAFQKGLIGDDRLREITKRYGVRVVPHVTGTNKPDPELGVAGMALMFMREEIDLPYADEASRREVDLFRHELVAWRRHVSGTRLRQDRVMTAWFGWLRWRGQRAVHAADPSQFKTAGSPLRRSA